MTIPDSVTTIYGGAFEGCTGLTNVPIPDSVRKIGNGAFEGCVRLKNVSVPEEASIADDAFPYNVRITRR